MTKITALIITLNEEKHIGACIDSLRDVADEVIVMDSFSADGTKAIAVSKGAKVIEKEFLGFGPQKNLGAEDASNDYIFSIDADEVLSEPLRQSLISLKANLTEGAFAVNRLNHIGRRSVRTCGWYPDTRVRLYNRRTAHWDSRSVHELLIVNEKISLLDGNLIHYSYVDYDDMKRRTERYAKLGAEAISGRGKMTIFLKMIINPPVKFLKTYFLQNGITDGYMGFMISYYKAQETFLKYYWALR
jgi:glycosyltransferase involved in cell wall biosynthesis